MTISRRDFARAGAAACAVPFVSMRGESARRILVHGHRGARARRPENTLPAFRYAIEQGVDYLELDVAVTRDHVAVVSHDPLLNPAICSGPKLGIPIHTLTAAELRDSYDCGAKKNPLFADQTPVPGTPIPTLDEVFELGRGNAVQFNVETKIFADRPELTPDPEDFTKLIWDSVRRNGVEKRMILQSFDPRTLRVLHRMAPDSRRAALFQTPLDWDRVAGEFEANILSPEYHLVTAEKVSRAHAARLEVVPWTVNLQPDWEKLASDGVDAIISDDPAALLAWLRSQAMH